MYAYRMHLGEQVGAIEVGFSTREAATEAARDWMADRVAVGYTHAVITDKHTPIGQLNKDGSYVDYSNAN